MMITHNFQLIGTERINQIFKAVLKQNKDGSILLPDGFQPIVEEENGYNFIRPENESSENVLNAAFKMLITHVMNNIMTHRWKRLKRLFQIVAYNRSIDEIFFLPATIESR